MPRVFLTLMMLWADCAVAVDARGPSLSAELAENDQVSRRIQELHLFLPVPVKFPAGKLLGRVDLFREEHEFSGTALNSRYNIGHRQTAAPGFIYLQDHTDTPGLIAAAARYSSFDIMGSAAPMGEYIAGIQAGTAALPFAALQQAGYETYALAAVRLRRFPGRQHWLGVAGLSLRSPDGWQYEVHIPSHIQLGYHTNNRFNYLYGELRARSRTAPVKLAGEDHWQDGYLLQQTIGYRRRTTGILYLSAEAGLQREVYNLYDNQGITKHKYITEYAPWVKIALETFIPRSAELNAHE